MISGIALATSLRTSCDHWRVALFGSVPAVYDGSFDSQSAGSSPAMRRASSAP